MSGKPATPPASRVAVPGAPRLFVYVADPRHLEPDGPGAQRAPNPPTAPPQPTFELSDSSQPYLCDNSSRILPYFRNHVYKQFEHIEQPGIANVYCKTIDDAECKISEYGVPEDSLPSQADFINVQHPALKENEEFFDNSSTEVSDLRKDSFSSNSSVEYGRSEQFPGRNFVELSCPNYQMRCPSIVLENNIDIQSVAQKHKDFITEGNSEFNDVRSEKDLTTSKNYGCLNYQFLEQSASHQSIVNQSIGILNQQGVSRNTSESCEVPGLGASAPQLVRTVDGVVLAVLPQQAAPVIGAHGADISSEVCQSQTLQQSDEQQSVIVPLGWRRVVSATSVLYISPSGAALGTLPQLRDYLQTSGTCKCGLPCPLRPEITFSFDPKVASKPYQSPTGAELTKLCNHKRKLLAVLQARANSPADIPSSTHQHEQRKVSGVQPSLIKKKMKKRSGVSNNISISQAMVQRDRPLSDFKGIQQGNEPCRTVSPVIGPTRVNSHSCPPAFTSPSQQNMTNNHPSFCQESGDHIQKPDYLMHKNVTGSHYLTVNSGCINQPVAVNSTQKTFTTPVGVPINGGTAINVGQPVLGTNGQIIGVHTGLVKPDNANFKNVLGDQSQNVTNATMNFRENKRSYYSVNGQHNSQLTVKHAQELHFKDGDSSTNNFSLNQALTPEVVQKINEQQQLFIQQNQKQIEIAMKGFRPQVSDQHQIKTHCQSLNVPQTQLVIHNGTVMKTNTAKTPPWQVKKADGTVQAITMNQNTKTQCHETFEYDDSNINTSDESLGNSGTLSNSLINQQNEVIMNQAMYSRVPPLPQHYSFVQQWPNADTTKKRQKTNKISKKKTSPVENKCISFGSNGMRSLHEGKGKYCEDIPNNNSIPSFMDDPSGYLAQQTVLLNNTISRQVGMNSSYEHNLYQTSPNSSYNVQPQTDYKPCKTMTKINDSNGYSNNLVPNPSPSPSAAPDSSMLSDKSNESSFSQCCKGCSSSLKGSSSEQCSDDSMHQAYMKQSMFQQKLEMDSNSSTSSPKHIFDDSPVTSSTFVDRSPLVNESLGPIQAGTVSTSNVSPVDSLQPPEPSPTPSNSSRSTDTPHSINNANLVSNCTFPISSPAYSNPGSSRDYFSSNPPTPGSTQSYSYNSPGPPVSLSNPSIMMHFISNHNVNKNLMEVDNISLVGVKPALKDSSQDIIGRNEHQRYMENNMPGYCPPPHLGGGPALSLIDANYVQSLITTMASGFSVTRDTITSVLAGKSQTTTTSINASQANFIRPPPPPCVNLATTYAIPTNQPDPFLNSVNLPTSYPLHIAGAVAQNMISKSPLEMVQNVIANNTRSDDSNLQTLGTSHNINRTGQPLTPSQILISSTGQLSVSNHGTPMPPPPPKTSCAMSPVQGSCAMTNVSTAVTQVMPAPGGSQQIMNQSTVVVNAMPGPFVLQPHMMTVDGQVVSQNSALPQIVTGGFNNTGQSSTEISRHAELKSGQTFIPGMTVLSPESAKKKNKRKKNQSPVTNILQITAPQPPSNNLMVHQTSPQQNSSPQFSPRSFQLSPNNSITSPPVLQALTIVPGKTGTPAHIVMNGQGSTTNFGSQQIIASTSPTQQINLLQPVNLINNTSGVMSNFPAFQQFILPNIGGMMMTADGTAIIQDNSSGMSMHLQLQTVNGQNVLTPVQNPTVFTAGANTGVVIRAQNQHGKIIQSQHSPGAQFLSPNSHVMMNSPNFSGQLSPLLANLSPTNVTFNTSPQHMRATNIQPRDLLQTNQIGQTLMVPLSPKSVNITSTPNNRNNSTFVQQNTTIVQQQTTLVSNSANQPAMPSMSSSLQSGGASRLSIDPNVLFNNSHKQHLSQYKVRDFPDDHSDVSNNRNMMSNPLDNIKHDDKNTYHQIVHSASISMNHAETESKMGNKNERNFGKLLNETYNSSMMNQIQEDLTYGSHVRHSVSTQTLVNQQRGKSPPVSTQQVSGCSPPDTTTHSPLGPLDSTNSSPRIYSARSASTQGNYADTTTKSPEPTDVNSLAMVQCVSSSEQDIADAKEHSTWSTLHKDFPVDAESQGLMCNMQSLGHMRSNSNTSIESSENCYNQTISVTSVNNQQSITITPTGYYDRASPQKRKHEFGGSSGYRAEKMMKTNFNMVHGSKDQEYETVRMNNPENMVKSTQKHLQTSPSNSDGLNLNMQQMYDLHNVGGGSETKSEDGKCENDDTNANSTIESKPMVKDFEVGDLIWGPVKGYSSWPGKLVTREDDGNWLVRWFGRDKSFSAVESNRLQTLSEGLEAHHAARTKHRKSRKLNIHLENAIQEAMAELDKKSDSTVASELSSLEDSGIDIAIAETPRRFKKYYGRSTRAKVLEKVQQKKANPVRIAPSTSKSGEGARLRSAR